MRRWSALAFVTPAVVLSGCFPVTLLDAPGYDLSIVDAQTHNPISGALVRIKGGNRDRQLVSSTADVNGHVQTKGVVHVAWLPLAFDPYLPPARLTISADGYQTRELTSFDSLFVHRVCASGEHCVVDYKDTIDTAVIALTPR
jgi:hypothetical protein